MDGVTILNTDYLYQFTLMQNITLLLLPVGAVVFITIAQALRYDKHGRIKNFFFSVAAVACMVIFFTLLITLHVSDKYRVPTNDVIIDDSVSFTEFDSHYEILYRDGAIYTVMERSE
jgi:hypothetical protein